MTWPEGKAVREMTDHLPGKRPSSSEILFYQTEDGRNRIEVRLEDNTVWLSQSLMAELFQTTKQNISLHIKNIFEESELDPDSVVKEYLTTAADGKREGELHQAATCKDFLQVQIKGLRRPEK